MRSTLVLTLLAACAGAPSTSSDGTPSYDSVRDHLAVPTRLFIAATPDAGTLGAAHYSDGGWQSGTSALSITDGALVAMLDGSGQLAAASFELSLDPIDVPPSVFGAPAQLAGVRLQLAAPAAAAIAWSGTDDATATISLDLELSWSLVVDGDSTPLGVQRLPPIPLDVTLTGDGGDVRAAVALHATGELWSWADLLKLTTLELAAEAATLE